MTSILSSVMSYLYTGSCLRKHLLGDQQPDVMGATALSYAYFGDIINNQRTSPINRMKLGLERHQRLVTDIPGDILPGLIYEVCPKSWCNMKRRSIPAILVDIHAVSMDAKRERSEKTRSNKPAITKVVGQDYVDANDTNANDNADDTTTPNEYYTRKGGAIVSPPSSPGCSSVYSDEMVDYSR